MKKVKIKDLKKGDWYVFEAAPLYPGAKKFVSWREDFFEKISTSTQSALLNNYSRSIELEVWKLDKDEADLLELAS
jgi:hypothetical protein